MQIASIKSVSSQYLSPLQLALLLRRKTKKREANSMRRKNRCPVHYSSGIYDMNYACLEKKIDRDSNLSNQRAWSTYAEYDLAVINH